MDKSKMVWWMAILVGLGSNLVASLAMAQRNTKTIVETTEKTVTQLLKKG